MHTDNANLHSSHRGLSLLLHVLFYPFHMRMFLAFRLGIEQAILPNRNLVSICKFVLSPEGKFLVINKYPLVTVLPKKVVIPALSSQ